MKTANILILIMIWLCVPVTIISKNPDVDLYIIGFQLFLLLFQIIMNVIIINKVNKNY